MTQHGRGAAGNSSRQIGPYELLQTLGSGGSAKVYRGRHMFLGTEAAIKVLHTPLDFEQVEQFVLEARTIASLEHPNIVRVLGFDVENNIPFLAMQYAPQGSMRQHHPPGTPVPLPIVVSYVKQIAQALQYAHDQGVIHCDVKPENMLLGSTGEVLLSDFGIAVGSMGQEEQMIYDVVGTIPYMAPEQIDGRPCEASDQYSTAVVVYEWLTGTYPFTGTDSEILQQHFSALAPSLRAKAPTVPPAVERVVMKALSKDPQKRYANITAFATALEEASKQIPPGPGVRHGVSAPHRPTKRLSPVIAPLLVILVLFVFGFIGGIFTSIFYPLTVTITPTGMRFVQNYYLSAIVGHPDPSLHQVYARLISSTAPPQSETVHTTGVGRTAGVRAQGELTFYNGLNVTQTVPAGTLVAGGNGIQVITDVDAVIPPINPPYLGTVMVPAHALKVGKAGNIEANSINQTCCSSDKSITVKNLSPFSAGQDPQIYSFVQQSDIDGAANTLEVSSKQKDQVLLQDQVHPNEVLISAIECSRQETSDPGPNEKATTVNVTIAVTCKGEAFDNRTATSITINLFRTDISKCLGGSYTIIGHILTRYLQATLADAKRGTIALLFRAQGVWIFQFSNAQKHKLVRLIVGKNRKDAHDLLLAQTGVSHVDIQTPWWVPWIVRDTLPTNTNSITLVTVQTLTSSQPSGVCVFFHCGICRL